MKVIILAGGLGSRLSKYTSTLPKPMVKIGKIPIIEHIMNLYVKNGFDNFIIAAGYKGEIIKKYFKKNQKFNVKVIDTGEKTLTGGRILRLKKYINNERFMLTYGDGIADIDIKKLLNFHIKNNKMITITAVRPPARFGVIEIKKNLVIDFKEKIQMRHGWINGGFFVVEPKFLKLIKNDNSILEREPLEKAAQKKQLVAYKHNYFWQCMDTNRDKEHLENLLKNNYAKWL
jgi:glucose-1-phosphate cytidylyltransferase